MKARSPHIVDELKTLQSTLAEVPTAMPFEVPGGYFADFADTLRLRFLLEENVTLPDPLPAFGRLTTPFVVPEGYFARFPFLLAEALEVSILEAHLSRKNIFKAPQGYFENLPEQVMEALALSAALPEGGNKEMPFAVPEGYFPEFSGNLMARVAEEDRIKALALVAEKPKTIPLRPRISLPVQMMRWAAAAVLILGVTLGIQQAGTPQNTVATTRRALAAIPENTLQEYVHQHADDFDIDMIEARLPQSIFQAASPVQTLGTHEIQAFLSDEVLL